MRSQLKWYTTPQYDQVVRENACVERCGMPPDRVQYAVRLKDPTCVRYVMVHARAAYAARLPQSLSDAYSTARISRTF
jgi:hypothetical protein